MKRQRPLRPIWSSLRRSEWVVYAKRPFAGPTQVLAYLARYTHRVAIANSRLISLSGDYVRFRWKDYRQGGRTKVMSLEAGGSCAVSCCTRSQVAFSASGTMACSRTVTGPIGCGSAASFSRLCRRCRTLIPAGIVTSLVRRQIRIPARVVAVGW